MEKINILYKGRQIYRDLSYDEATEVLDELSEKFYNDQEFDLTQLELEEF